MNVLATLLNESKQAVACRELTDRQLMDKLIEHRDEQAFDVLLRRHGPMVWSVCSRIANYAQDAEDAFQATFLILVKKASTVQPRDKVGNWLYGVAMRAAQKARSERFRRQSKEKHAAIIRQKTFCDTTQEENHLKLAIEQALDSLPLKYRIPIVLCDLQGMTRQEAARTLDWPEGSVAGRLARGRQLLAKRLIRLGLPATISPMAATLSNASSLPVELLNSTRHIAAVVITGSTAPVRIELLIKQVTGTMLLTKLKWHAIVLAVALSISVTAGSMIMATTAAKQKGDDEPATKWEIKPIQTSLESNVVMDEKPQATHPFMRIFAFVYLFQGEQLLNEGNLEDSVQKWETAHRLYPECSLITNNLAWCLTQAVASPWTRLINLMQANRLMNQLFANVHPNDKNIPHYHGTRGTIYLQLGRFEDARHDLEIASKRPGAETDAVLHKQLIEVYERLNMPDLADNFRNMTKEYLKRNKPIR